MNIKILGPGCRKCRKLEEQVHLVLKELGIAAEVEKIQDNATIMSYGVLATPALVINDSMKVYGRVPDRDEIKQWICEETGGQSH